MRLQREREYGSKNKLSISENRGSRARDHLKSKRKGAQSRTKRLTCAGSYKYALSLSAECHKERKNGNKKKEHFRKTAEKQKHHARISKNHVSSDIR